MEVIINKSKPAAICLSDGEVYFFKGNEMCRLKDCVIVEREIFEHLKQEADHYE